MLSWVMYTFRYVSGGEFSAISFADLTSAASDGSPPAAGTGAGAKEPASLGRGGCSMAASGVDWPLAATPTLCLA